MISEAAKKSSLGNHPAISLLKKKNLIISKRRAYLSFKNFLKSPDFRISSKQYMQRTIKSLQQILNSTKTNSQMGIGNDKCLEHPETWILMI